MIIKFRKWNEYAETYLDSHIAQLCVVTGGLVFKEYIMLDDELLESCKEIGIEGKVTANHYDIYNNISSGIYEDGGNKEENPICYYVFQTLKDNGYHINWVEMQKGWSFKSGNPNVYVDIKAAIKAIAYRIDDKARKMALESRAEEAIKEIKNSIKFKTDPYYYLVKPKCGNL